MLSKFWVISFLAMFIFQGLTISAFSQETDQDVQSAFPDRERGHEQVTKVSDRPLEKHHAAVQMGWLLA